MSTESPLLPPEPWYTSPVQRAAVAATVTSIAALVIQLFDLNVDVQIVNAKIALVVQILNLGFTAWAVIKRQTSTVQPLTMTQAGADAKADTAQLDKNTLRPKEDHTQPQEQS